MFRSIFTTRNLIIFLLIGTTLVLTISMYNIRNIERQNPTFNTQNQGFTHSLLEETKNMLQTFHSQKHISLVSNPDLDYGEGRYVAAINFSPEPPYKSYHNLFIELKTSDVIEGWTFNLGNSITNDGWAGDSGTNYYDSELYIIDNTLHISSNDYYDSELLLIEDGSTWGRDGVLLPNESFIINVSNNRITLYPQGEKPLELEHPGIFNILYDQDESNADDSYLFMGINRVVHPGRNDRNGSGIDKVEVLMNFNYESNFKVYLIENNSNLKSGFNLELLQATASSVPEENSWISLLNEDNEDEIWLSLDPESEIYNQLTINKYYYTTGFLNKNIIRLQQFDY